MAMKGTVRILVIDKVTGHRKGFGFIRGDDGADYFFHRSGLQQTSDVQFDELNERQRVEFTGIEGEAGKGPRAIEVRTI
jgi:cold shock CspA family protein